MSQNLDRGAFVYDVNATDDDVKSNGQVEYVIMHGGEGKFVINSTSGVITTDGALDRERKNFYTVRLKFVCVVLFKMYLFKSIFFV